jgi:hypothetical protein
MSSANAAPVAASSTKGAELSDLMNNLPAEPSGVTPSKLPRPSPVSTRSRPLHALYPTRLPIPGSSNKNLPTSSSIRRTKQAFDEPTSNEIFERKLAEVLDMDQALAFAPSSVRKEDRSEKSQCHTGYTPLKKAPVPTDEEVFVVTKKMEF